MLSGNKMSLFKGKTDLMHVENGLLPLNASVSPLCCNLVIPSSGFQYTAPAGNEEGVDPAALSLHEPTAVRAKQSFSPLPSSVGFKVGGVLQNKADF